MAWRGKVGLVALGLCFPLVLLGSVAGYFYFATSVRPPAPPNHLPATRPWGAVDFETVHQDAPSGLQQSIADSFKTEPQFEFDPPTWIDRHPNLVICPRGGHLGLGEGGLREVVEGRTRGSEITIARRVAISTCLDVLRHWDGSTERGLQSPERHLAIPG